MYSNVSRHLLLCYLLAPLFVFADQPAGQQLFGSSCAGCHGLDGRGGEHAPNIATNESVQRLSDADLAHIVRNGIPAAGMPAFGSSFDNNRLKAVVSYLRVLQGKVQTAKIAGDAKNGRKLFFGSAGCSECHMMNGQGGFLGADLSGYGGSHSPDQIRESILNPGKNRDPRNGTIVMVTRSGREYTGIVRNEDNFSVQMQTRDGVFHFFDKSDLARIEHPARSLMPSQYGSRLTRTELDDLISYLVTSAGSQLSGGHEDDDQ
jgi:putative heme-binding domain-containing protein